MCGAGLSGLSGYGSGTLPGVGSVLNLGTRHPAGIPDGFETGLEALTQRAVLCFYVERYVEVHSCSVNVLYCLYYLYKFAQNFSVTTMNLKRKASGPSNQTRKKRNNVVDSDSSDDGRNDDNGSRASEPNQNDDDEILDTTEIEKSKREEAVKKISEYTCGFDKEKHSPLIRKKLNETKGSNIRFF